MYLPNVSYKPGAHTILHCSRSRKGCHGQDESEDRDAPTPDPWVRGYRTSVRLPNTPSYLSLIAGRVSHFIETLGLARGLRRSTVRYQVPYLAAISRVGSTFLSIRLSISNFWKRKLSRNRGENLEGWLFGQQDSKVNSELRTNRWTFDHQIIHL